MGDVTYHIKIKKEYASAIIEDLQLIDAIEIVEDDIPQWQKEEVMRRLAVFEANPSSAISKEAFFAALDEDDEV